MKKHLLLLFAALLPLVASAQTKIEIEGIWYNLVSKAKQAEVTFKGDSYNSYRNRYSGSITLPATVTYGGVTYSVTSIGEYAFFGCTSLTAITLPEGVTSIGNGAFRSCLSLTTINIPEGVTSIGEHAFWDCSSLTSITLPEGVTSIGDYAFNGCASLTAITLPEGVTSIGNSTFRNCRSLTAIVVAEGNKVYDSRGGCNAIIETSTNTLLHGCSSTIIPESVTSIGEDAFYGCSSLTAITIPEGVTSIGSNAFSGCSNLERVTINCANVGDWISKISSIKEITLGERVTSIGSSAFINCYGLTAVYISSIEAWCEISFSDSYSNPLCYAHNLYLNGELVTGLVIPEGVTSIGSYAFYGCINLKELTLGKGLKKIASSAFSTCGSLEKITIHATQPPRIEGNGNALFSDATYENATLYVPQGSISKYQVMTGWSGFYNISEIEGDTPDYLTLRQADNGEVGIAVDLGRTYKVRITPSTGWKIHTVTFDGKDMTAQLAADNTFTTPTINGSAVLNVAYVKEGSAIAAATASRIKVQGHQGTISIAGATEGEAIGLYTTSGTLVATATAEGDTTQLTVPTGQVYIVKVADAVVKIGM